MSSLIGVRDRAPKNVEFGAFLDLNIASEQCNVAMKLYEMV